MHYQRELIEAAERTARFGLKVPEIVTTRQRFLTPENDAKIRRAFAEDPELRSLEAEDVSAQCLLIHNGLVNRFAMIFGVPVLFTLGYVRTGDCTLYFQDEASLAAMLRNGIDPGEVDLHAWITLPSMELIDMTLCTTWGLVHNEPDAIGRTMFRHADELNGMSYHPLLVGNSFLRQTGVLLDIEVGG